MKANTRKKGAPKHPKPTGIDQNIPLKMLIFLPGCTEQISQLKKQSKSRADFERLVALQLAQVTALAVRFLKKSA